ncbi:uncharacterized protein LOC133190747 [Saccostrea echinata]|uniref:uncharacterized protein LOC133190747 n=1 Tax=Saccostrea echinata TaxID=191078 RepID=UPI002A8355A7|nr:uncharacterized protein LOC133190747 [Saccostrea echinata]
MGDEAAKTVVEPAYLCDEKKKDGFVHVIVSAKDLKTSRTLKGIKIIKKAENAVVDATFEERSFEVTVKGKDSGKLKGKCYQLKIKKLPYEIVKEKSYMEVEDDRVILYLNKQENKSWYPELESGLETEEEEG